MSDTIDNLHAEAKATFTPAQKKLLDAIGEAMALLGVSPAHAIPVFEWWIKWERCQQQR